MLETAARVLSLVADAMTVLGISGLVTWSLFRDSPRPFERFVLRVLVYSSKCLLCVPVLGAGLLLYGSAYAIAVQIVGPFDRPIAAAFLAPVAAIPTIIAVLCVFRWSLAPWRTFRQIFVGSDRQPPTSAQQ